MPFLESCRRRFGQTFTAKLLMGGGRVVFISDPSSIKALFAEDRTNARGPGRNRVIAPVLGSRSLLVTEGEEHVTQRRLMLPGFHGDRMRAHGRMIEEVTELELGGWPTRRPFPLFPRMQVITLEVMLRAIFGGEQRREELRQGIISLLDIPQSPVALGLGLLGLSRSLRRRRRTLAETDRILAAEIGRARADPDLEEREDTLSMLATARDEHGEAMSDEELRDQVMTLLVAGYETTSTALAWAFDLLFRHPDALERLRAEVDGEEHAYTDAVVAETLRLRPSVPLIGRTLGRPLELDGYELPAGTVVLPAIFLAHTREDTYPEPYAFRPERFLEKGPETFSWLPFGGGARRCIGGAFAQFEMRIVLRTILRGAELRPASEAPEPIVRRNTTISPRSGTPAIVERHLRRGTPLSDQPSSPARSPAG